MGIKSKNLFIFLVILLLFLFFFSFGLSVMFARSRCLFFLSRWQYTRSTSEPMLFIRFPSLFAYQPKERVEKKAIQSDAYILKSLPRKTFIRNKLRNTLGRLFTLKLNEWAERREWETVEGTADQQHSPIGR